MFKSTKVTAVTHLGDDLREWLIVGRLLGKVSTTSSSGPLLTNIPSRWINMYYLQVVGVRRE